MLISFMLYGCGGSEPVVPPKPTLESEDASLILWPREKDAIKLTFVADKDLNWYSGRPHSIQVCIYQLEKPDAFLDLIHAEDGITKLLSATLFDASVKNATRVFLQPHETATYTFDRAENTLYVGIVAGYFDTQTKSAAKVWEIKPAEKRSGLVFKTSTYSAGALDLHLRLTARSLEEDTPKEQFFEEDKVQEKKQAPKKEKEQTLTTHTETPESAQLESSESVDNVHEQAQSSKNSTHESDTTDSVTSTQAPPVLEKNEETSPQRAPTMSKEERKDTLSTTPLHEQTPSNGE